MLVSGVIGRGAVRAEVSFVEDAVDDRIRQFFPGSRRGVVVGSDFDIFQGFDDAVVQVLGVGAFASIGAFKTGFLIGFPFVEEDLEKSDAFIAFKSRVLLRQLTT